MAIAFQIIGRSTQNKIVVMGGGLTAPRYVLINYESKTYLVIITQPNN